MARPIRLIRNVATISILAYGAPCFAVDCFIDSANGDDGNTGLSEEEAVRTQAKIPSSCTVAKYKRGSVFAEKLKISNNVKTYTNYGSANDPLPKFVMPGTTNTGAVVSSYQGGITIDGLYLANSHGDGTSSSFSTGVCVQLGGGSVFQNNEITSCDIGVMLMGTGSKFLNNYVHDLNTMIVDAAQDSGTYINSIGGAEGIFVNGSDNEVAYNTFINCSTVAAWTGGSCDGGATEVSVGAGSTLSGVRIHHNFAYNTCGFFEVSGKGTFADSEFSYNVVIDSGWLMLLQVNETTMSNIRWENNTVVQHKGSTNAGMITTIYGGSGTSGGPVSGVTLPPGQVSMANNLIILDGVNSFGDVIDKNITQDTNIVAKTNPGVVNISGISAADFDLVEGSSLIDQGTVIPALTLDFLNRVVPSGSQPDIGAFEYGAAQSTAGGSRSTGGAASTGGAMPVATGGRATGGQPNNPTGGVAPNATGGAVTSGGTGAASATGGANNTGGAMPTGGAIASTMGGSSQASSAAGGIAPTNTPTGGDSTVSPTLGGGGNGNAAVGGVTAASTSPQGTSSSVVDNGACSCTVVGNSRMPSSAGGWLVLLMLGWQIRRKQRTASSVQFDSPARE